MPPFVIFSLPRSRSAWLSVLFSHGGGSVGHDIGIGCRTPEDFAGRLQGHGSLSGTCETGAAFAWRLIRDMLPDARFAVVRRDPHEVVASLERFGFTDCSAEIKARDRHLDEIAAQPDVMSVDFKDLADPAVCGALFLHCTDRRMSERWWGHMDLMNVQVDMPRRIEWLIRNADSVASLKSEVTRRIAHG